MHAGMPGPIELLIVGALAFGGILGGILWLFVLVDCLRNEPSEGNEKLIWVIVIVFTTLIGAVLYLVLRRPERIRKHGK